MNQSGLSQAQQLLPHCLDQQGALSTQAITEVVKAIMASQVKGKAAILRQLKRLVEQENRRQQATVTSVTSLDKATQTQISTYITKHHPAIRRIVWQEDPNLLGGFTIQMGDMWYDLSIVHDLQTIREHLSQ